MKTKTKNTIMFLLILILILGGLFLLFFTGQKEGFFSKSRTRQKATYEANKDKIQAEIDSEPPEVPPTDFTVVKGNWLDIKPGKKNPPCEGWSLEDKVLTYTCEKINKNKSYPDYNDGTIDMKKCKTMAVTYSDKTGKLSCQK